MSFRNILLLTINTSMALALSAQEKRMSAMEWNIATHLPPQGNQPVSLGFAGPVAGIHRNRMFVAGGANFPEAMPWLGGKKCYYDDVYVLNRCGNSLCVATQKYQLPEPIAYAASATLLAGVAYAGGENEEGIRNRAYLLTLDMAKEGFQVRPLPSLPVGVSSPAAAGYKNQLYVAGGESAKGTSSQFAVLDLDNTAAGWKMLSPLPVPTSHAVLVALENNGRPLLVLIGGRNRKANGISELYNSVYAYDPDKGNWIQWSSLPYVLSAGTGIGIGNESILLFGGDRGETFGKVERLIAQIQEEKDESRKQELIRQKNLLQINHPGFSRELLRFSVKTGETEKLDDMPFETAVTTTAVAWGNAVYIPSGEIRAGVRTPRILEMTMPTLVK